MRWFPFLGFEDLTDDDVAQLGLDQEWEYRGFFFEWLDVGFLFFVQRMRQKVRNTIK